MPDCLLEGFDDNTFFLGDLNAKHPNWGCSTSNARGNALLNLVDDRSFLFLNDGSPTHSSHSYNTKEALDISIVSPDIYPLCKWTVSSNIGSDHHPILIDLDMSQKVFRDQRNHWNFRKANWGKYKDLTNSTIFNVPQTNNIDSNWNNFANDILSAAKQSIPRGKVKKYTPFFSHNSDNIEPLLKKREVLSNNLTNTNNESNRSELNKVNAEIKRKYTLLKRQKWNELCTALDSRTPDSKLWKLVKNIEKSQPQTESCNTILAPDGSIPRSRKEAADILGQHYSNISKLPFTALDKPIARRARNLAHQHRNKRAKNPLFSNLFSPQELELAIGNLNLSKSPGPDGIYGHMILHLGERARKRLLDIINLSWAKGRLPRNWKKATIIPIRKPDKNANSPESHRPISLTSIPCKIMEKMVLTRLTYHLNSENLLPKEQFAFRKGHSTTDQVLYLTQKIKDSQNIKPTNHTIAVFLDLSKAFDKVWWNLLILKLHDNFQIKGSALSWIADFLKARLFRVKYHETLSSWYKLHQGVPQGSVLSPTLFSLFLAGLEGVISQECEVGMFADDIALWCSGSNIKHIETTLNSTLIDVGKFANNHKLTFNVTKSFVTLFTTNRHLYSYQPQVLFQDQPLSYEKHPKYLGFVLDQEITCNRHISNLVNKSRKRLNILKYISGRDWGADATTLRLTYISFIRPILEYGFPVYFCASTSNLLQLERVQLSAARIITGMRNSCPNDIVLYEANLPPLGLVRNSNLVKYYNKLRSYENQNRTSAYLSRWSNNQRLKRNSPFGLADKMKIISQSVEYSSLTPCVSPAEGLPGVHFNAELPSHTNKNSDVPEYLRQLALEVINSVPSDATLIFTDGSKDDSNNTGSGIFIENLAVRLSRRNPDHCSVFRCEMIAIKEGLKTILHSSDSSDVWIFTDSRSSIQHLQDWSRVCDLVGIEIIKMLISIAKCRKVHIQWIPSHVNIHGNEAADILAKEGCSATKNTDYDLTYQEIFSMAKNKNRQAWLSPPAHPWYSRIKPGGSLDLEADRQNQTAVSRLISGHLKCMTFESGTKVYPLCNKCNLQPASPKHILDCLGLTLEDVCASPLMVLDFARLHGLMDMI